MRIILDAMGGDNAPQAPVMGAIQAAKDFGAQITLVGRGEEILQVLKDNGIHDLPQGITVTDAEEVVDMHDDPANVIRKKKNSSLVVGLRMLAEEEGDAFICAGSTGALLSGATLIVKRVKGIRRAAMGPCIPNKAGGKTMLLDCGANAECTPEFLLQFGLVGSLYMKKQGIENPRVGLLNIGSEDTKGTPLQKEAYALLTKAAEQGLINFIGNIVMFLPFGFFTALLWREIRLSKAAGIGLCLTAGIECWQLLVGRAFDIDDLALNALGVMAGYLLWMLADRILPERVTRLWCA